MNEWIGYITRSYETIKESVIGRLSTKIPEITDYSSSNIFIKILSIWAGLMEMLGYYVDNAARETFLISARQYRSGVNIAQYFNYRIKAWKAATVNLTFTLSVNPDNDFTIPANTEVRRADGVKYFTLFSAVISTNSNTVNVDARQAIEFNSQVVGISDGTANQKFIINGQVVDTLTTIIVNGDTFSFVENFILSSSTDKHFTTGINEDEIFYIQFGDGVNGEIPSIGQNILATYFLTSAENGNSSENSVNITDFPPPSGLELVVTNQNRATGGGQKDSLNDLKKLIPNNHRIQDKAVTDFDYSNLALQVAGVAQAISSYTCGKTVTIYIAPNGGGIATNTLLNSVVAYFAPRKMVSTDIVAVSAGSLIVRISANVLAVSGSQNSIVKTEIENTLISRISVDTLQIKQPLYLGDIYQIIENITNVVSVINLQTSIIPFVNRLVGVATLNIVINIFDSLNEVITWKVAFVSPTSFQLFKNNIYLQTYSTETLITLNEVSINISNNNYIIGDTFEFTTYPNNANIFPNEFSVISTFAENLDITVTGGV